MGVCINRAQDRGSIYRMSHLCSSFCTDNCYAPPKASPSLAHGCEICNTGFTLKGEGTCLINCPNATEIPNSANDACVLCPSCCGGSSECSYDFSSTEPSLKCHGTVDPGFNWDNGNCAAIPPPPPDPTNSSDPPDSNHEIPDINKETIEFDYEVVFNKKKLQVFVVFDVAPISFSLENNVKLTFEIFQKGAIIQGEASEHTSQTLSRVSDTQYRIDIDIDLVDYKVFIDMEFQNLVFLSADSSKRLYKRKQYKFKVYKVSSYFGLDEEQEKSVREVNGVLSDYGLGLNVLIPGFAALVAPLNKLRLLALSPTIFEF